MEGPSLFLAQEQLQPFCGKVVLRSYGNTKIGPEQFLNKKVLDIFAWGKHLVFQFDDRALRVHFLLFGTFEATVEGESVTGDYKRAKEPRLAFEFENGSILMFNSSVKVLETSDAKSLYDFSIDVMSRHWDSAGALQRVLTQPEAEIADVLLDQTVFAGVGNIIKNEVLWMEKIHPTRKVKDIEKKALKSLIDKTVSFSHQFYVWRKAFVLRKNLVIYRQSKCPRCETKVVREKTGSRERMSFYCPVCQT